MATPKVISALLPEDVTKVGDPVMDRLARGKARLQEERARNTECLKMWRGEQYVFRTEQSVQTQATVTSTDGGGKPPHRVRTKRNLLIDIAAHEVAAAVQRVPNYEIDPSTTDPEDVDAARLAGKVARYGYDKWNIRSITEEVATYAVVTQGGFAWPYWDSTVAPYVDDGQGGVVGQGEVGINVYGPNETFWEPGLKFDESKWHAIEQARTPESVMQMDGYLGGELKANAESSDTGQAKLVLVTEYLERPSKKYPNGRWMTIANEKQIVPERPFPCQDENGNVVDEPVLHYLPYFTDPDSDRDMGIVEHLMDAQRTINHTTNKQLEWLHLAMMPQIIIQNGEFKQRITDEPGQVYHAVGTGEVKWREVGKVPDDLSQLKEEARADMAQIAAQNEIPSQVSSGQGIQSLIERDQARRYPFIANLAEFHSRLMRHCLYLVQKHYTEERLLKVRGRFGPENISGFLGSQIKGQADVTVLPGSIEPRSRAQTEQRVMTYAQLGWIGPEEAMAAINGGTAEGLIQGYEEDVARANLIIQKLRAGPDVLFAVPPRQPFPNEDPGVQIDPATGQPIPQIDPTTGQPAMTLDPMTGQPTPVFLKNTTVPGWMPRPFDDIRVQKTMLETWMKTTEWDALDAATQEASGNYYAALLGIEQQEAQREAMLQTQQAQDMGMMNAAKPQDGSTQMPSLPGQPSENGSPQTYQ